MKTLAKTMAILLVLIAGSQLMLGQNTLLVNNIRTKLIKMFDCHTVFT